MQPTPAFGPAPGPAYSLQELPGATASLVLGICSIVFSLPILGLVLGLIGLSKSRSAKRLAAMSPGAYGNAGIAQGGYVCSIIGVFLGAFTTMCGAGYFVLMVVAIAAGAAGGLQ